MATINRGDLIRRVADATGNNRAGVRHVIAAYEQAILDAVAAGHTVTLQGFASLGARYRGPRTVRNPRAGTYVEQPAHMAAAIRPGKQLRAAADRVPLHDPALPRLDDHDASGPSAA